MKAGFRRRGNQKLYCLATGVPIEIAKAP